MPRSAKGATALSCLLLRRLLLLLGLEVAMFGVPRGCFRCRRVTAGKLKLQDGKGGACAARLRALLNGCLARDA